MEDARPAPVRSAPIRVNPAEGRAALDRLRPALFMQTFLTQLAQRGDALLERLFRLATDPEVADNIALGAIDRILALTNAKDILAVALGLRRQRGRPGEDDAEERRLQQEWADAVSLEETPPGSGNFE